MLAFKNRFLSESGIVGPRAGDKVGLGGGFIDA